MIRLRIFGIGAFAFIALTVAGCGGSPDRPSTLPPGDPTTAPNAPTAFRGSGLEVSTEGLGSQEFAAAFVGERITFNWNRVERAEDYILEVGEGPVDSSVFTATVPGLTLDWNPTRSGNFSARVKARNVQGVGQASPEVTVFSVEPRDYVEWLFLGTGPHGSGGCANPGLLGGWRPGTAIRLVLAPDLPAQTVQTANSMASEMGASTLNVVTAHTSLSSDLDPQPQPGDLTLSFFVIPPTGGIVGQFFVIESGSDGFRRGRVLLVRGNDPTPHELGHALYGFCHHASAEISRLTTMGAGGRIGFRLTEADRRSLQAVYAAGLRPGASRERFVQAGLIR